MGYAITRLPEDFKPHKQIRRVFDQRRKMIETGEGIDWAMAEALAFGTLLSEGARRAAAGPGSRMQRRCLGVFRVCRVFRDQGLAAPCSAGGKVL